MWQNSRSGQYELREQDCLIKEEKTAFPLEADFSPRLKGATGTEVVCMGDTPKSNTWSSLDKECSFTKKRAGKRGSGYGYVKFLTHRFWDDPPVKVTIDLFNTSTGKKSGIRTVRGLKHFMQGNGCHQNGVVDIEYEGLQVKAYWCIMKGG